MAFYVTGDTHRDFERVYEFCEYYGTSTDDVLVICGDAGINYYCDQSDRELKLELSELPLTLFCVHGNHEERPELLGYEEMEWRGGIVYYEERYPNLLFAKDGEIYDFDGKSVMAIGGAYSVDKYYRISHGLPWFESELPTDETMDYVERQLALNNWLVDYVFTHTVPIEFEPVWAFIPGLNQSLVDKTMEKWLQRLAENMDFECWFAGHYHVDHQEGPIRLLFNDFEELSD